MMCREYVGNFSSISLHINLFTFHSSLITSIVDSFFLIMNT